MKVLLIGSGGREDALAWAIGQSPKLTRLDCVPGNAGIDGRATLLDIDVNDHDAFTAHASRVGYDLVVIGPEGPLVAGLADRLRDAGLAVFGPSAAAARIEGSKAFSKRFMERHGIPTGAFCTFDATEEAVRYLESPDTEFPLVIKADGLAAGKGVILADDRETALNAARGMLSGDDFGTAGSLIVIEEMLHGREASFFVLSDGHDIVELATCQDYKRALDGDHGLNTGGMGTYSPSAYLDETLRHTIVETIVGPTLRGMAEEGFPYHGVLYVGLMLTETGPRVIEYNARFGDPETQVLVPRLDGDWLALLHACATGRLAEQTVAWKQEAAVCVVMTAGGYPQDYPKGMPIAGITRAEKRAGVVVFHAGTLRQAEGSLVTSGGRVLGVTALAPTIAAARERAYTAVSDISWEGEHHRTDIAQDAAQRQG